MKVKVKQVLYSFFFTLLCFACTSNKNTETNAKQSLNKDSVLVRTDFKKYFDSCSVQGSIVTYDYNNNQWIVSDTIGIKKETLPASTFKIINLLIALETNTIKDENEIVEWVGKTDTIKYGYRPDIYHDMTIKEAFEVSAGWVFIELAKKIGIEKYMKYLALCNYGNQNFTQPDIDFWNFGRFGISPMNQVEFLKHLYDEKLPFTKRNMAIVKRVMVSEQTETFTLRSKTGWTRDNNINTGWWIGYIETKKGPFIFATRLLQNRTQKRADFGSCRKNITLKVFKDLKIIE